MLPIHQFIYTKVPPDLSPFKKTGFHTLFYPVELFDKKTLLEIESCLHFPGADIFDAKRICLFKKIHQVTYQVLIYLKSLPEAKDEFGRTGIFLAQGFLLPPELWQKAGSLYYLDKKLREYLVQDNFSALESAYVDKSTGNIQPVLWEEKAVVLNAVLAPDLHENERKLTVALVKMAQQKIEDGSIALKGTPAQVEEQLERCFCYLPNDLKVNLGFDSGFDGGKIFFYPLKIVGYSKNAPTTGSPLFYDCAGFTFGQHEKSVQYLNANTLFERWVVSTRAEFDSINEPNRMYQIVQFLEQKTNQLPENAELSAEFITANEILIKEIFAKNASSHLPSEWVSAVTLRSYPDVYLEVLMSQFQPLKVADLVQKVILTEHLPAKNFTQTLPNKITEAGSPLLNLIFSIWKNEALTPQQASSLTLEEQKSLFEYLVQNSYMEKDWFYDVWMRIPAIATLVYEDPDKKHHELLNKWLKKQLEKEKEQGNVPVAYLTQELIEQQKIGDYLNQSWNKSAILEAGLHAGRWGRSELQKIYAYAKANASLLNDYPFLRTLVQPSLIAENINWLEPEMKRRVLDAILILHPKTHKTQLFQFGFTEEDLFLSKKRHQQSLIQKIKGFFGRKSL